MPVYNLPRGGTQSASGLWLWRFAIEIPVLIGSLWLATEYVAWRFHWDPRLGTPLLKTPFGNIYYPWEWIVWCWRYHKQPGTLNWWHHAVWIISIAHIAPLLSLSMVIRRDHRFGKHSDMHGSARFASRREVKQSGLYKQQEGVYVGAWKDGKTIHYLRHNGPEHVIGLAPTRTGKGVGLVIPTLVTYPYSVLVNDIKGENYALSAGWRKQQGQVVMRFDPTCQDGTAARWNPLLEIRPYPSSVRDTQNIIEILTDEAEAEQRHSGENPHWKETAKDLLMAVILYQLQEGKEKSLSGCLSALTNPRVPYETLLRRMVQSNDPSIAGSAQAVVQKSVNEGSGVISTAIRYLNLYRDPIVAENTSSCDFGIRDLMYYEKPVSLYLTTPPSDLARTRPLFRMLLAQLGHRLTEDMQGGTDGYRAGRRLLLMQDEFTSVRKQDLFNVQFAWLSGYGIQCYFVIQSLSQLEEVYGKNYTSILENCHIQTAFTPNAVMTAETLSTRLGTMTVSKETRTYTGSRFSPWLGHVIASDQESQRPLLSVDEVMTMDGDHALIFVGGQHPIYGHKIRYYDDPEFLRRSQIPPPAQSDRIPFTTHPWTHVAPQSKDPEPPETAAGGSKEREALQELRRAL